MTIGSGKYLSTYQHNAVLDHSRAVSTPVDITSPSFLNSIQKVHFSDFPQSTYNNLREDYLNPISSTAPVQQPGSGVTKHQFTSSRPFKAILIDTDESDKKILNIEPIWISEAVYPNAPNYTYQSSNNTVAPDAYIYSYFDEDNNINIPALAIPRSEAYGIVEHFPENMKERTILPPIVS